MTNPIPEWRLGRVVVEPKSRRLLIDGAPAKIGARAFDILTALIERRHRAVAASELFDLVWPKLSVEPGNLQVHIFALRKLLGADAITTIPGRGYRLTATVEGPAPPETEAPPPAVPIEPGNLPIRLPPLYGREADLQSLRTLIEENRLVSVVGPGGIGKTRLAQAVGREMSGRFRDGVWLVELAPISKAELVAPTVARAFGQRVGVGGNARMDLADGLRGRHALVVLDNCEHVIDAVADLSHAVLAQAPQMTLLVTSQRPTRLRQEQIYRLGSLAVPAKAAADAAQKYGAVELFVARAHAAGARFRLNRENLEAIVDICARLDGIALAIELAAARAPLLGCDALRRQLDDTLRLLVGGPREASSSHRAISAALQRSYGLLSSTERRALDQLGIFVGGFSLRGAQHMIVEPGIDRWAVVELLASLVDNSLVIADLGAEPRYRLLEPTRAFALERLAATGDLTAARRKHGLAMISLLRTPGLARSQAELAAEAAPEIDNLRAAAAWAIGPDGDREIAIKLASESNFIWHVLGFNDEGASLFRAVEPWVDASTPPDAAAGFWLSRAKLYPAGTRTAAEDALRAADVYRVLRDKERLFDAMIAAASQFNYAGEPEAAARALAEAESVMDPSWPLWTRVGYAIAAAAVPYWIGDLVRARDLLGSALALSRDGGDPAQTEWIEMMIVGCATALRQPREALAEGLEMLGRSHPTLRDFNRAATENFVASNWVRAGELDKAETLLRAVLPRSRRAFGTVRTALCYIAHLLASRHRFEDAARLLGAVDGLRRPGAGILAPPNRAAYDDAAALSAAAIGGDRFARLTNEGRGLSEEAAVRLAFGAERLT